MAIPKRQLDRWTKQGAVTNSKKTYGKIERALKSDRSALSQHDHDWEIYLQGSYANHTNIYGDSDVDIVVRLKSTWRSDLSDLPKEQRQAYNEAYVDADYTGRDFYEDVRTSLYRRFSRGDIEAGSKAIKVKSDDAPIPVDADVVPCVVHRNYNYFHGKDDQDYDEGMNFRTRDGGPTIINYSKLHKTAGENKNSSERTNGNYKATIRMFKNVRNKMREERIISDDAAPSYYIECLLSNVPDRHFKGNTRTRYQNIVGHLKGASLDSFTEQCGLRELFDQSHPDRWNKRDAQRYITGLETLWDSW